jgi:hypothetical protein
MARYIGLAALFLTTLFIINSCRKELKSNNTNGLAPALMQAKTWYESTYLQTASSNKSLTTFSTSGSKHENDLSQLIQPDWNNSDVYNRLNSDVIEMPVDPASKYNFSVSNTVKAYNKAYTKTSFILLKSGEKYEAYVMVVAADSGYVQNDLSKLAHNTYRHHDADFSGMLFYFTPKGVLVSSYTYKSGHIATSSGAKTATNTAKLKTQSDNDYCIDWYLVTFDEDGNVIDKLYLYTECPGDNGGTPPPPCLVVNSIEAAKPIRLTTNEVTDPGDGLTDPTDGGFPQPTPPPPAISPCTVVPIDTTKKPIDTCALKHKIDSLQSNLLISNLNTQVLNATNASGFEYGTPLNLRNNTNANDYLPGTGLITQYDPQAVDIPFSWDSILGFTIGLTHGHPGNDGPSPDDVFKMIDNLLNSNELPNASAADKAFYKANAYVNTVNSLFSYQVRITDWSGIMVEYNKWRADPVGYDLAFSNGGGNKVFPSEYSLLSLLGNYIVVYKASNGGTSFRSITIGPGDYVTTKNCPQ